VRLQREVFNLPEIEISPVRHLVVTNHAGGFTLGAFVNDKLVGFVLSVPAVLYGERALYSHMTAVSSEFQGEGIGAKLKWAQREEALNEGIKLIKWTFEPAKARNAYFNLEKLGAIAVEYQPNFYGTDYPNGTAYGEIGIPSDRLFAIWRLEDEKVERLSKGEVFSDVTIEDERIYIPSNWQNLLQSDRAQALETLTRIRNDFENAFGRGLVAGGFVRDAEKPYYRMFYENKQPL
jgi:predicted GNAT superfamily acetyltransferase